jgi:hypothetical protein
MQPWTAGGVPRDAERHNDGPASAPDGVMQVSAAR